jgi:hypothetical protein
MPLTQNDLENLIDQIRSLGTESDAIDCKEDLHLDERGDRASFIRDIAAMANNMAPSYLLIGFQDRTWQVVGLPEGSELRDAEPTQRRMNQILGNRLDPQLAIEYQVFEKDGMEIGVVCVDGQRGPYLIAIEDAQYGGDRTRGEPVTISRGNIFIRHGDTTQIVNRQSRLEEILDARNSRDQAEPPINQLNEFLSENGYQDVDSPDFGHNNMSQNLRELVPHVGNSGDRYDEANAKSWVSFCFLAGTNSCTLNPRDLQENLKPDQRIGRDGSWFHGLPAPVSDMFYHATANPRLYQCRWSPKRMPNPHTYIQAFDILPAGIVHFMATSPLFSQRLTREDHSVRVYSFTNLIGYLWQFTYVAKAIYHNAQYLGDISVVLNLIGSCQTMMADFAQGSKKKWFSVFDWEYSPSPEDICNANNIQITRKLSIVECSDEEIELCVREIAFELGQYFGQDTPQCFTPDTNEFPIADYVSKNSRM